MKDQRMTTLFSTQHCDNFPKSTKHKQHADLAFWRALTRRETS